MQTGPHVVALYWDPAILMKQNVMIQFTGTPPDWKLRGTRLQVCTCTHLARLFVGPSKGKFHRSIQKPREQALFKGKFKLEGETCQKVP